MDHEAGEEYDCDACGDSHVVQRGKGLDVQGTTEGLDPALYVRCPEAGFVSLSDPGVTGDDGERSTGDSGTGADDEGWP